ncbi:MAG: glycosyltransferase family 39 protein [Candidatus Eisenbacteria bacterium]|nr:glycosyltransferase family 39 protein [Candidatus Eisenbacteria bacterium]
MPLPGSLCPTSTSGGRARRGATARRGFPLTASPGERGKRALPLLVALVSLALSLLLAGACPLVDPDEGRNAEVAREMAAGGDLLVPHLAGMPYLDKPPGLFWAAALPIRVLGNTPLAARVPSAIASALTLWLVARLALRRRGAGFALAACALLFTAPLFAVLSAYVIFDMPLALCVTAVWVGLAEELESRASARRRLLMFAAVTAGLFLKGPVVLAWVLGGSLGAALLLRSRAPLRWLAWWPGWVMVLVLAGGWFALAARRYPEYPHYAFLEESLERLTTGAFKRQQPAWFVPAVLVAGALPWSLATPWTAKLSRTAKAGLGFVLFAAVFFTLSRSKLVTYLLPALPPLAWAAAEAWSDATRARRGAWALMIVFALLAAAAAAAGWGPLLARMHPRPDATTLASARLLAQGFAALALFSLSVALSGRPRVAILNAALFTPVLLAGSLLALWDHAFRHSGAPLAVAIATFGGGPVRYESCYSPGTDYLRGRISTIVSARGRETTSNYQVRYRESLIARGEWTPLAAAPPGDGTDVVVRPSRDESAPPAGYVEFFRDERFVAFRRLRAGP